MRDDFDNLRHVVRESGKVFWISNAAYLLNFLGSLVLVRSLSPTDFGYVATALGLIGIIEMLSTFSLNTVLIQRKQSSGLIRSVFQLAFVGIGLRVVIGLLLLSFFSFNYDPQVKILFIILLLSKLTTGLSAILIAQIMKSGNYVVGTLLGSLSNIAAVGASIFCVWLGGGVYGLVIREALPPVLLLITLLILYNEYWPTDLSKLSRKHLLITGRGAVQMYFQRGAEIGFMRVPLLLIESWFGANTLGLYTQATYLVTVVNRATNSLNSQVATVFFSLNRRKVEVKKRANRYLIIATCVLGLPVAGILQAFSVPVVQVLWGDAWLTAAPMVQSMALLSVLLPLFTIFKARLSAMRRNTDVTIVYLIGLVILAGFLLLLPLGDGDSIEPIGVSFLLSYFIMIAIAFVYVRRSHDTTYVPQHKVSGESEEE